MNIEIEIETTPNPKALKFVLNHPVKTEGKISFQKPEECQQQMERDLFALPGVTQVHYFENVITISQDGDHDWGDLAANVKIVIETRLAIHDPKLVVETTSTKNRENLSPELKAIEEILDRTIRPGLQGDGGDLEVISLENLVLTVNFQGACGSCPSSTMGTLYAIEGILQQEYDPGLKVRPLGIEMGN